MPFWTRCYRETLWYRAGIRGLSLFSCPRPGLLRQTKSHVVSGEVCCDQKSVGAFGSNGRDFWYVSGINLWVILKKIAWEDCWLIVMWNVRMSRKELLLNRWSLIELSFCILDICLNLCVEQLIAWSFFLRPLIILEIVIRRIRIEESCIKKFTDRQL